LADFRWTVLKATNKSEAGQTAPSRDWLYDTAGKAGRTWESEHGKRT
jgi:hypothetical protein